jgi:hypothetical protein
LLHGISLAVISTAILAFLPQGATAQDLPPATSDVEGIETLTHGPIHEAFAAPTGADPAPGPVIAKQPPAPVDEEPPALKAEGALWIPGYWEWDDEMKDFIWISGNWRVPPPGMRWVPPYWTEVEGGWQRVPGFWVSADAGELEYRETPPESLENGPSGPAPADNYFWIPGTWNYYDTGYRWRTGYWSPYQADWVWCPARWVWTPSGCVYVAGFWDHRLAFRGHLFAPIHFRTAYYLQPGWRYRPWCVVPSNNLFVHLWYRPQYNCYYFGDYYGSRYAGWIPWYRCGWGEHRRYYDPLVSWCRTHYRRQGIDYIDRIDQWHDHFVRHDDIRPPRTWRDQVNLVARTDVDIDIRNSQRILGAELRDLARRGDLPVRLTQIDDRQREVIRDVANRIDELKTQRVRTEAGAARVAARVPLGEDADPAGRSVADRVRRDAEARAGDLKLRLPKVDTEVAAKIDAALGNARTAARTRDLPTAPDPGPAADRTGRAPEPEVRRPDAPTTEPAKEVVRDLRDRGIIPDDGSRTPRTDAPERGPRVDVPERTPRVDVPDRTPRVDVPERTPRVDVPDRTPRVEIPDRTPGLTPRAEIPETPRVEVPDRASPAETPELTPRTGIPSTERPEAPRIGNPLEKPRAETPELTPRTGIPSTERPEAPRIGNPLERPRAETPELTPRTGIPSTDRPEAPRTGAPFNRPRAETPELTPRVGIPSTDRSRAPRVDRTPSSVPRLDTPRVDTPRITPRVDIPRVDVPRSAPRVDVPRVTPRVDVPRTAPRVDIPRTTPRIDVPRVTPRVDVPRSTPRIDAPRVNPRIDIPRSSPRIDIPRGSPSRGNSDRSNRDRDRD